MAESQSFNVLSYNCRGFNKLKSAYIKSLLANCAVLFLQEHWLSVDQLRLLNDIDAEFQCIGVSGFDNSDILSGRPFGGCAILWRSDLSVTVNTLPACSRRVCAIRMANDNVKLLFINVYMPYEGDDEMSAEFADQLSVVENLIYDNPDCHVIVGGDFNVDFSRDRLHTALLSSFCENVDLNPIIGHNKCTVDYTYFNLCRFNVVGHFLLTGTIFHNSVSRAFAIHDVDNISDHEPTALQLVLDVKCIGLHNRIHTPHVSWIKANASDISNYRCMLSDRLRRIKLPVDALLCNNLQCCDAAHFNAVNLYAKGITDACIDAAMASIPLTCDRQTSGRITGWSEFVQPLRDKSLFWHRM